MAIVRNLVVRAGGDFTGLRKSMQKAQKNVQDFKNSITKTLGGIGAAFAGLKSIEFFADATRGAMAVEAAVQQINRTMGQSSQEFMDWAQTQSRAFNMSKTDATKYGAIYGNLLSTFANGAVDTKNKTIDLLKASAVVASGTGRTMDDVMWRIRSGLLGNTEAIEDLGINVYVNMLKSTQAFRQFAGDKSWDQLDFKTQQLIRYYGIMEQANKKFGAEVNQNTNSSLQKFTAVLGDIKLRIGQAFLPIMNVVLPLLTKLAVAVLTVVSVISQAMNYLFGSYKQKADAAKAASERAGKGVNNLGAAYQDTGKKAKEAAKQVLGFDEVNTLNDPASSAADTAAPGTEADGLATPDLGMGTAIDLDPLSDKVKAAVDKIKSVFTAFVDFLKEKKDIIVSILAGVVAALGVGLIIANWSAISAAIASAWGVLVTAFQWILAAFLAIDIVFVAIVLAVAAVVAAFVYFYRTNEQFRGVVDGIFRAIGDALVWLWKNVMVPMGEFLGKAFVAVWKGLGEAAQWVWKNVMVPFGGFLENFWKQVIVPLGGVLKDVLGVAFDAVAKIAKAFWEEVLVPMGKDIKEVIGPTIETLKIVFDALWKDCLVPLGTFLGDVFLAYWGAIVTKIQEVWDKVKPFAEWLANAFVDILTEAFQGVGKVLDKVKEAFLGILTFIQGVFTGDWKKAFEGLGSIVKAVFEGLIEVIKIPLNAIISMVNKVIEGLNKLQLPDWAGGVGINIPKIPKLAKGGITNGEMVATIGDNPGGREVVSPLNDLLGMIQSTVGTAMANMALNQGSAPTGDITLQIDGVTFARVTNGYSAKENTRIGGSMITVK
jgi:hypothetical protein